MLSSVWLQYQYVLFDWSKPNGGGHMLNETEELMDLVGRRIELIECLQENSKDKRMLSEEVDASRSTVDRGIRELESVGLITWKNGEYIPTLCGYLAASAYRQFEEQMQLLTTYAPCLRWMPPEEFDLELKDIEGADLYLPERGDPYAMINRHVQIIRQADSYKILLPLTGLHAHQAAHENTVSKGAEGEAVVVPSVADTWQNEEEYAASTEEMVATGRFRYFVSENPIPYFVGIFNESIVQIGVDEENEPRALLETTNDEVVAWAERKFQNYKQQAHTPFKEAELEQASE